MSKSSLPSAAAALSLVLLVYPPSAEGQSEPDPPHTSAPNRVVSPPDWGGELAFLSGNAALGGLTAALIQELQGGSFWRAFLEGALGGAVVYGGKRIAVERFCAAGLVGRQVAAVGTSMVHNVSDGRGALERLVLPIGLARLYLWGDTASALPVHARVSLDLPTVLATAYLRLRENTDFTSARASQPVRPSSSRGSHGPSPAGLRRKSAE